VSNATWHVGDTREVLRTLPDASVDLVMTSPPFLALRSYLPADHPDKALEIGSEGTPGAFLDVLLDVTEELARVLAPHGSLVVELGDTYSGSGGAGGDYTNEDGWRAGQNAFDGSSARARKGDGWPLAKSLCMIPSTYAWALAYGRNPWTGRETPAWRVRNLIAWTRSNPPVGALGDKFRPGTSYLTVACKSGSRYFDLDAVREPNPRVDEAPRVGKNAKAREGQGGDWSRGPDSRQVQNAAGAPPLDWWEIPTQPYAQSHYATYPKALCVKPILAMSPQRVCRVCGKPSERITQMTPEYAAHRAAKGDFLGAAHDVGKGMAARTERRPGDDPSRNGAQYETVGWTDCPCPEFVDPGVVGGPVQRSAIPSGSTSHAVSKWRNGVVLDPFAGSGTTGEVATGHGRDFVGIDLDPRNLELARQRIGMFLVEAA
jgi:hypothetical protein